MWAILFKIANYKVLDFPRLQLFKKRVTNVKGNHHLVWGVIFEGCFSFKGISKITNFNILTIF